MDILVKRHSKFGRLPNKAKDGDAGWDLYAADDAIIEPGERQLVSTDISMEIPEMFVGLIWDRSGLAIKRGLHTFAGVIDSGYRGEVKICLWNSTDSVAIVNRGDRVAQILFQPVPHLSVIEVQELSASDRGEKGFGSTGS